MVHQQCRVVGNLRDNNASGRYKISFYDLKLWNEWLSVCVCADVISSSFTSQLLIGRPHLLLCSPWWVGSFYCEIRLIMQIGFRPLNGSTEGKFGTLLSFIHCKNLVETDCHMYGTASLRLCSWHAKELLNLSYIFASFFLQTNLTRSLKTRKPSLPDWYCAKSTVSFLHRGDPNPRKETANDLMPSELHQPNQNTISVAVWKYHQKIIG